MLKLFFSFLRVICFSLIFLSSSRSILYPEQKMEKPNIILIVADDQGINSIKFMPNLNRMLINKGITFKNCFVSSPVCGPSRASILLGQYMHNHRIITNNTSRFFEEKLDRNTIATVLKKAGYKSVLIGKYLNGYSRYKNYIPPGWDKWYAKTTGNYYYNYELNENGKSVYYKDNPGDYITDVMKRKALHFIEKEATNHPFFMYIGTIAPHSPNVPANRYKDKFKNLEINLKLEDDISDKPEWVRNFYLNNPGKKAPKTQKKVEYHRNRLRTLLSVDDMIAEIVNKLMKQGRLKNTYIFYTSDNGGGMTKHIRAGNKLTPYREGINVPLVVCGPNIPSNKALDHLVSTVDLLPTFADLAGVKISGFVDGRSLLTLLRKNPLPLNKWRQSILVELGPFKSWVYKGFPPEWKLICTREYKYIEYITGEHEFYDLKLDPGEMNNIYNKLKPERQKALTRELKKMIRKDEN